MKSASSAEANEVRKNVTELPVALLNKPFNISAVVPARYLIDLMTEEDRGSQPYDEKYDVPDAALFRMNFHFVPAENFCDKSEFFSLLGVWIFNFRFLDFCLILQTSHELRVSKRMNL